MSGTEIFLPLDNINRYDLNLSSSNSLGNQSILVYTYMPNQNAIQLRPTFPCFLRGDALSFQPLIQDIHHLPSKVDEEQRKCFQRHIWWTDLGRNPTKLPTKAKDLIQDLTAGQALRMR